jgi:hypothetical protein
MITRIFTNFQPISNLCKLFIIPACRQAGVESEISGKGFLITPISKEDYTDFLVFSATFYLCNRYLISVIKRS